jgi:hypothetical protein
MLVLPGRHSRIQQNQDPKGFSSMHLLTKKSFIDQSIYYNDENHEMH